jgi:hypothetical protein
MYLSNNHPQHTKSLREHCSILALSIKKLFLKNKFLVKVDQPQSKENGPSLETVEEYLNTLCLNIWITYCYL